jgi:hypothetical protein
MFFDLDPKELSFLGGAASTLIAALSYWAKTRHEGRRATRTVLYYLLEVHHTVNRTHEVARSLPDKFMTVMRSSLQRKGVSITEAEWALAKTQVFPVLREFMSAELVELLTTLRDPLERALAELARENPVLAFRIRGRDQITLLNEKIQKFAGSSVGTDAATMATFETFIRDVALKELQDAIYAASFACDVLTLCKVHLSIRRSRRPLSEDDSEMEAFIESMLANIGATNNNATSGPKN